MTYRLIAAAAGLILTGGFLTGIPLRAEVIEQVLVKVNGEIVSKSDFEQRLTSSLARPEYANAKSDLELQKAIGELTPDLILEAVDELLLTQRGRELNYSLSDAQFKEILENIKKQNNLTEEAQFQAALKQEGMTLVDLRRNIERSMMISQVQSAEVTQKLSATEEEAREYFEAHRSDFTTPSEVMLREILIEVGQRPNGHDLNRRVWEAGAGRRDYTFHAAIDYAADIPVVARDLFPGYQHVGSKRSGHSSIVSRGGAPACGEKGHSSSFRPASFPPIQPPRHRTAASRRGP